jgi:hypothetical protein
MPTRDKFCEEPTASIYARIEDHGAIGNMHTIGLAATDGTLDWLCMPHVPMVRL